MLTITGVCCFWALLRKHNTAWSLWKKKAAPRMVPGNYRDRESIAPEDTALRNLLPPSRPSSQVFQCGQVCLWSYLSAFFISPLPSPGLHCFIPNIAHLGLHSTAQVGWRFIKEPTPSVSLIFHIDFQLSSSLIVAILLSVALVKRT